MRNQRKNPLGDAVRARRIALGLSQDAIAARAQVSGTTWRKLENGDPSERRTLVAARIEAALGWPNGTLARMEAGDDAPASEPEPSKVADELAALRAEVAELKELLTHLPAPAQKRVRGLRR